ncbi:MAG: HEPN domain-containing protein [Candidatus Methanomethyliaceae archaeon]|nr:HEPN domain-containing protein [Candidatus Methanomethyliaceae archaeon]
MRHEGRPNLMREEARWWIEDAKRCLEKAEKYLDLGFYEDTVFNCQQALEKLFKGLWIALLKRRPIKTHKITSLYKPLEDEIHLEDELKDFLSLISPYYFITRYPDIAMGLPGEIITKNFALDCLTKTRRILECSLRSISKEK